MKNKQQGFTLIELMIVVAIIGALSAAAIPAYQNYLTKTEAASAAATMKSIITPAELFYQEKGTANAVSVADLGTTSTANKLGVITSTTGTSGAVNLIFTFGSNSSINNDTLTFTRDPSTGWSCSQSTNVPEFDGCS